MQCFIKYEYKTFLLNNYPKIPTLQDATPQTGRSRFGGLAPRLSTTGLDYSILVRGNFGLVMLWDRFIFVLSTTLHQRNFEIVPSILVGSERRSRSVGGVVGPNLERPVWGIASWCLRIRPWFRNKKFL